MKYVVARGELFSCFQCCVCCCLRTCFMLAWTMLKIDELSQYVSQCTFIKKNKYLLFFLFWVLVVGHFENSIFTSHGMHAVWVLALWSVTLAKLYEKQPLLYLVLHLLCHMKGTWMISHNVILAQVGSLLPRTGVHPATTVQLGLHTGQCMGVRTAPTTQTMANMKALSVRTVHKVSRPPVHFPTQLQGWFLLS